MRSYFARCFRILLSSLIVLAYPGNLVTALRGAGEEQTARAGTSQPPPALPRTCLEPATAIGNVARLLDALRAQPTARAWNTLGALYAQRGALACAIPAFRAALRLEPDS